MMKNRKLVKTVLLSLTPLLAAGYMLAPMKGLRDDASILTAEAARRDFSVVVQAVGKLDAANSTTISSEVRGDRGKIIYLIEDGIKVKQGDVLVRLDPTPFEEKVTRLEAKLRENEAFVAAQEQILDWEKNQAVREVSTAEFDLKAAELDLLKLEKGDGPLELAKFENVAVKSKMEYEEKQGYVKDLVSLEERGYANPAEIKLARNKVEEARQTHETTKRQFESYRDYVFPSLIEKAKARVAQSKTDLEQTKKGVGFVIGKQTAALRQGVEELATTTGQLKSARITLDRTVIRAPIPGMVVIRSSRRGKDVKKPRVGDVVWQNQPIIYLPNLAKMVVKTQIREIDLHKVTVGKSVTVHVDAFPELRLSGVVESIGVLAESRTEATSAEKYFQVLISTTDEDQRLRPGMTARVEINSAEAKETLSVPVHAVFREGGRYYVFVDIAGSYEKREVSLGVQNEEWAHIVTGLMDGERVALSLPPESEVTARRTSSQLH